MNLLRRAAAGICALGICAGAAFQSFGTVTGSAAAAKSIESQMKWGTLKIGGGGFVSGIVTGQKAMYARTDVGGAYRYNYETNSWDQLLGFLNEEERGFLSVDAMAIDPTDDDTAYFLCGCAYFSGARTAIFKTTDGGKTFTETDVTDLIQVHGNGYGRQNGEAIAIDPDDPNTLYCGGDVTAGESALIKSTDGGKTWKPVKGYDDLGLFPNQMKWPSWTEHIVRAATTEEYGSQNGVACIKIFGGKVYVGTSSPVENNLVVADVDKDEFTLLSKELPQTSYPARITQDADNNLLITYVGGLAFASNGGGIYRYNIKDGSVEDISPSNNSFGEVHCMPGDSNTLIATTCGLWNPNGWSKDVHGDGEWLFRSVDGGKNWESVYAGKSEWYWDPEIGDSTTRTIFDYMQTGGIDWVYGNAIHWSGSLVLNPADTTEAYVTSGNGVFVWTDIWGDNPIATFHPDGIEEVVSLDMVSVPGGDVYSVIGDYDGFVHDSKDHSTQFSPRMDKYASNASAAGIGYCPQNTDVLVRYSESGTTALITVDAGKNWVPVKRDISGGKAAITEIKAGKTYRVFSSSASGSRVYYADVDIDEIKKVQKSNASIEDSKEWEFYAPEWTEAKGIDGTSSSYILTDLNDPSKVYAYNYKYDQYWASNPNLKEPAFDVDHYSVYYSSDYGATFTENQLCRYDMCDHCGDLAYVSEDTIAAAAGWYGLYLVTDGGKTAEKLDSVFYAKTVGYGAPEKKGAPNTLFIYGKPSESDAEGIYRSTDAGKTWVCINTSHLYGGTGNGNFLVGDMNQFGTVYMSTVGCGIVYGMLSDSTDPEPTTVVTTVQSPDGSILWGDANVDGKVNIADAVAILQYLANQTKYGLSEQGGINADIDGEAGITGSDAIVIQQVDAKLIKQTDLPLKK